jgi:replication factor C subunit 2/4
MLISGEPGVGKTSTILALVREIIPIELHDECILELNASDDRGIKMINNTIIHFCKKKVDFIKTIILDEADSITLKAQNLIINIMEQYGEKTKIIFICNDSSQIIESLQSRCLIMHFPKLPKEDLRNLSELICFKEKLTYEEKALDWLIFISDYDTRQIINNLQVYRTLDNHIEIEKINKLFDLPSSQIISNIFNYTINQDLKNASNEMIKLYHKGYYPSDILLTFMNMLKYILDINEDIKIKYLKIISKYYIRANDGNDNIIQLMGCLSELIL